MYYTLPQFHNLQQISSNSTLFLGKTVVHIVKFPVVKTVELLSNSAALSWLVSLTEMREWSLQHQSLGELLHLSGPAVGSLLPQ